ncbi:hypothetical protein B0T25DRAFT_565362 [Lasiosphaeria hispida]|uniref:F-box domain-containing protein n=1 Tax=Lasiosphaeria hispida TaxID=260671 RepID=A0AAJ0MIM4_9PEZI|nr:hypothetical protein B0T25DRAFT_565362 [Lasiosphaeria hispida]
MAPSAPSPRRLLHGLPDDVLLPVMSQADDVSLFCLRRVSRIFLSSKTAGFDVSTSTLPFAAAQKDLYCQMCRNTGPEAELRLRTELLYCSSCLTKHPAGLFAYGQRHGPAKTRICIGREGNVRIRDQMVITWADVEEWFASGAHSKKLEYWLRQHGAADIFPQVQGKYPSEFQFFDPKLCTYLRFDVPPDG